MLGGVLAVFLLEPLSTLQETDETARITNYAATMDLSADGILRTEEAISVDLPPAKHGIFRIFDTADPRRNGVSHPVTDVSVTRDGQAEPFEWVASARGTENLRIGSPDRFVTMGVNDYVIRSTTTDALEPGRTDETVWWWDVVGSGWQMPMDAVSVWPLCPLTPCGPSACRARTPRARPRSRGAACVWSPGRWSRSRRSRSGWRSPRTRCRHPRPGAGSRPPPCGRSGPGSWPPPWGCTSSLATRERRPGFPVLFEPPQGMSAGPRGPGGQRGRSG